MDEPIRLGVSACLLGHNVRYNGGHALDRYIVNTLGSFVEFVPVCPEVECGFDTPRESFRLVGDPESPRFVTSRTGVDYTDRMTEWARRRVEELEKENLCGFIFKKDSPSSGMERVRVYTGPSSHVKKGVGMFARAFMEHFPLLPTEEEGRLHDPKLRENFIESLFALRDWRKTISGGLSRGKLVEFHTRHKFLIRSHSPRHHSMLGKLTAQAKEYPVEELFDRYRTLFLEALRLKTTPKKNTDVLYHIMGYFKGDLTPDEKQELIDIITNYHQGHVPLVVPVTLLNHYARKYEKAYVNTQSYMNPHPVELQLRNHA